MVRCMYLLAILLFTALLPVRARLAHAGTMQLTVNGAPAYVVSADVPDVLARALAMQADFNPSIGPSQYYVVARVALHNSGSVPFAYSPADFTLEDPITGVVHTADTTDSAIAASALQSGLLQPGATVVGDVAFLVSAGEVSFNLRWVHAPSAILADP